MPQDNEAGPIGQVEEVLFDRGTLMDLFIGKPTFQKKLRANDVLLEGVNEDAIYLGHKKLMPKRSMEKFVTIEGRARNMLYDRSLDFPLSGARFVFYAALPEVRRELLALKVEWDAAFRELIDQFDTLKEEQLAILDRQSETLAQNEIAKAKPHEQAAKREAMKNWVEQQKLSIRMLYPKKEELSEMFRFTWRVFKISPLTGLEEMTSMDQEQLIQAREEIQRDLERWIRQASIEMHKTLGEAAANALSMLEKNGKLQPRNMKPLFDAFDTFKAVDFTGASSFQQVIDMIKSQFGRRNVNGEWDFELTTTSINGSPAGMDQFKGLLSKVGSLAIDQTAESAGIEAVKSVGEFRRVIKT
jgi:predicted CopG family antitoxin